MSRISKITIGATINVGNFSNIKVEFDIVDFSNEKEGIEYGIKNVKEVWERFSQIGELKENKVASSLDKIKKINI